jgi:FHS family L-fucose permease-like MFS transporter
MLWTVYFISFFCGMAQCFESVFLPEFKEFFHLGYQEQMYTMFAKNIPFLFAFFVGSKLAIVGYKRCLTIAMLLYAAGTLLLLPGLRQGRYELLLLGFFLIGSGFTVQIVAMNPLLSALGPRDGKSSRLNFGNALGAIAQIIAPATLSFIIPAAAISVTDKLPYMRSLFQILGFLLIVLALVTLSLNDADIRSKMEASFPNENSDSQKSLWHRPKVILGFVSVFLALGVEASLFGFFRNYVESPAGGGLSAHQSERLFTLYFLLFALGRVAASWLQTRIRPSMHMAINLLAAILCLFFIVFGKGYTALVAITVIGFFVSIFYPTLYAIATEGLGDLTGRASGLLTLGFLGCAIIPVLQGRLADSVGIHFSYATAILVYSFVFVYVLRNPATRTELPGVPI